MAKSLQSSWFVSTEPFANTDAQQFLNSAKSSVVVCLLDMSLLISSLPIIPVALLCFILIERLWNVVQSFVCLSSQHFNWWRQGGEDCSWVKILELETNFEEFQSPHELSPWPSLTVFEQYPLFEESLDTPILKFLPFPLLDIFWEMSTTFLLKLLFSKITRFWRPRLAPYNLSLAKIKSSLE